MKIAILDDEYYFAQMAKLTITQTFSLLKEEIEVHIFTKIADFLTMHEKNAFDLVFLDIDMPEISGLVLAEQIRQMNQDTDVIFLSNQEHLVFLAIECQPFRFIRKRFLADEIYSAATAYLKKYNEKNINIIIEINKNNQAFRINDILYFESSGHQLIMHTVNGRFSFRGEINKWEKRLANHYFVRSHSGYLVNMKYVGEIEKTELFLDNGTTVPVSRRKMTNVKTVFHQYMREQL